MAAPDPAGRFADATALLNYGYAKCSLYQDLEEQPLVTVPVRGGVQEEVLGEYDGTFSYLSMTGEDLTAVEKKWYAVPELTAPDVYKRQERKQSSVKIFLYGNFQKRSIHPDISVCGKAPDSVF